MHGPLRPPCEAGVIAAERSPRRVRPGGVLAAAVMGSSLAFIDGSALGVALPAIQGDLAADAAQAQWIANAYLLTLGAFVLVGGAGGDRFGRRRVFATGVVLFALASVACALAPDPDALIWARGLQGVGAALLTPASLALIGANFPKEQRGRAFGLWAGFGALAGMAGPLIGGALADFASWRVIFWINLPLAAAALILAFVFTPESRDPDAKGLDLVGAALAVAGLAALTWGLTVLPERGATAPTLAALAGGSGLAAAFIVHERRAAHPMTPPSLFASRVFSGMNVLTFLLYFALGGVMFFLPFDLIRSHGFSASAAGAALLPFAAIMGLFSGVAGRIADRSGARLSLSLGPLLAAVGLLLLAVPGPGAGFVDGPLAGVTVLAIGMTLVVGPLTATVMGAVSDGQAGVASGVNNAVARVAGLVAVASLGGVLSLGHALGASSVPVSDVMSGAVTDPDAVAAFHNGVRAALIVCAVAAALAGAVGAWSLRAQRAA